MARGYGVRFIAGVGKHPMNDNRTQKKKGEVWVSLFVMALVVAIPGGIIAAWQLENAAYLAVSGIAFLIFAAGGAL